MERYPDGCRLLQAGHGGEAPAAGEPCCAPAWACVTPPLDTLLHSCRTALWPHALPLRTVCPALSSDATPCSFPHSPALPGPHTPSPYPDPLFQ